MSPRRNSITCVADSIQSMEQSDNKLSKKNSHACKALAWCCQVYVKMHLNKTFQQDIVW